MDIVIPIVRPKWLRSGTALFWLDSKLCDVLEHCYSSNSHGGGWGDGETGTGSGGGTADDFFPVGFDRKTTEETLSDLEILCLVGQLR